MIFGGGDYESDGSALASWRDAVIRQRKALKEIKHKIETHLSIPEDDTTHGFLLMEALEIINKELSR